MTRKKWIMAVGMVGTILAGGLLLESWKGKSMRMTAVEKSFVNSSGHAAKVAGHAESLLQKVNVQPGWRYLDVGCGISSAARGIAMRRPLDVVGVDIDPEQIATARAAGELPNLRFHVMDATRLEFGDAEFDVVATSKTTHHIPDYELALMEMARVLRPGGYLVYTDMSVPGWAAAIGKRLLPIVGFPSEHALDSFAVKRGLRPVFRSRNLIQLDQIWVKQ